jgi:hypothetical protein
MFQSNPATSLNSALSFHEGRTLPPLSLPLLFLLSFPLGICCSGPFGVPHARVKFKKSLSGGLHKPPFRYDLRTMILSIRCVALVLLFSTHGEKPLSIPHVASGAAELRQTGRLTVLELRTKQGKTEHVALTHPSEYFQGTNSLFEAKLIAESPDRFLIFSDSFESNPGNVQGMCGASETGEQFIHVVALGSHPHETFAAQVESCLSVLMQAKPPEWRLHETSGGSMGTLTLSFDSEPKQTLVYFVSRTGDVSKPTVNSKD